MNATPVGMPGTGAQRLLPLAVRFHRGQIAYDLVYGTDTDWLRRARRDGARALEGTPMLLAQAALSFERWTGRRFPVRHVKAALGSGR